MLPPKHMLDEVLNKKLNNHFFLIDQKKTNMKDSFQKKMYLYSSFNENESTGETMSSQQDLEHKIVEEKEEENQETLETVTVEKLEKLSKTIKNLIVALVSITLLLDGMLNMIILPIIPEYVKYLSNAQNDTLVNSSTSSTKFEYSRSDLTIGFLFATKPLIQLIVNPFGGTLIDNIGYKIPMAVGLCIQFASTLTFALTNSFRFLFLARILQGKRHL